MIQITLLQTINTELHNMSYPELRDDQCLNDAGVDSLDLAVIFTDIETLYGIQFGNEWREYAELPISKLITIIQNYDSSVAR